MSDDWKKLIKSKRRGSGYFLQQTGVLQCKPRDYAKFRSVDHKLPQSIMSEWTSWMRYFKLSGSEVLRDAANDAPNLDKRDFEDALKETLAMKQQQQNAWKETLEIKRQQLQDEDDGIRSQRIVETWLQKQHPYLNSAQRNPPQNIICSASGLILQDRHSGAKAKRSIRQ